MRQYDDILILLKMENIIHNLNSPQRVHIFAPCQHVQTKYECIGVKICGDKGEKVSIIGIKGIMECVFCLIDKVKLKGML